MSPLETYWPAIIPVVIEGLWLLALPSWMREFRRQRELEETFGHDSDFVETNYRFFPVPVWVGIAFMVYHLPCLVLMFLIPGKTRTRHRLLVHVLLMVLTVSTYTALVAWACSVWATHRL